MLRARPNYESSGLSREEQNILHPKILSTDPFSVLCFKAVEALPQPCWITNQVCLFSQQLENSLNEFGEKWVLNPGDGAFYGPKVSHVTPWRQRPNPIQQAGHRSFLLYRSTFRSRMPLAGTISAPPFSWISSCPSASTSPLSGKRSLILLYKVRPLKLFFKVIYPNVPPMFWQA